MTTEYEDLGGSGGVASFSHEGFFYSHERNFLEAVVPFVTAGVDAGEQVMVAVDPGKIDWLSEHFGSAPNVEFVDMFEMGRNPSRIIGAWHDFVERNTALGRRVRGVGEPVWPGRSDAELDECRSHEMLLNVAFADSPPWRLLCPYDTSALEPEMIEFVEECHPFMNTGSVELRPSHRYRLPEFDELLAESPLPEPAGDVIEVAFDAHNLRLFRMVISTFSEAAGLNESVDDFVISANEIATNSVRHGGSNSVARLWLTERGVVCDISNRSRLTDPLVGRTRPGPDAAAGRGLWLANQLCDLVQLRSSAAGTVVRLHMLIQA